MNEFYRKLKHALESLSEDIWTETVLEGTDAGQKRILSKMELYCRGKNNALKMRSFENNLYENDMFDNRGHKNTGNNRIFLERIGRIPRLVICGGGHVSVAVAKIGKMLGFYVTVLEDRPKFADHVRAAGADHVICSPFENGLAKVQGNSDTWFVIVTRGHKYDMECLEMILKKQRAYVGMMGSRRRVAIVKDQLEERGVDRAVLETVHTPIGLKIKAETPEEIAVSVMAEIIQIKNSREKSGGYSKEMIEKLFEEEKTVAEKPKVDIMKQNKISKKRQEQKVLATIISRKGSAPRSVGTKMLIMRDGNLIDTIGGGCVESEVVQKSLLMMRTGKPEFQICKIDMTADAAEDEGMVCGGIVEVMLELIKE